MLQYLQRRYTAWWFVDSSHVKIKISWIYVASNVPTAVLVIQGARASAGTILTWSLGDSVGFA